MQTIDLNAVRNAKTSKEPYDFLLADHLLKADVIDDLRRDFPDIEKPGYLTVDEVKLHGRFKTLIEELEGPELTEELSKKFGLNLHQYPRLTTIMKRSQPKYGAIHTDGPSKVMTMLVYMNDEWNQGDGGRLRVLYDGQNFEPYALEVPPTMGTMFAFLRSDNSWHGHRPFVGERRVVQIAWVKSQADVDRKKKHNKVAQFFKGIFGR
ncbi:2OG-Fe(II) oxygenase [Microvirga thermotolerans]|uniref:2OG-Fe(II) oxygenase n=1 Tax=Microvirga thermotolerans TaxID=2651334 RepID=A0A5P9JTW3_9HYPH|nr:2OG-Fe(II) oxygenase [Microvirga thermotolerans]QFU16262.1 2OG-Fe(II) oxygenase [Microvirga thermotolerans]